MPTTCMRPAPRTPLTLECITNGRISDGDITLVLERPGEKSQAKNFQIDEGTVMSVEEEDDMSVVPYAEQSDDKGREGFNWILLAGGLSFLTLIVSGFT